VIGQAEAVRSVSNALRISRAGLHTHERPLGVFLFLGPTGVGKTELCKALAEFMFDTQNAMVRIDMSEYMEKFSLSRLIGAPPGYVGSAEGGVLTEAVRRRPYSLVLFDEFEKAHREVSNLLLHVMDEGTLTDSQAHKVDFKNTMIIMTSNLGADVLANLPPGAKSQQARDDVMSVVRQAFPPEFLNRIDDIILFNRLQRSDMDRILNNQIINIQKLLHDRKVVIEVTPAAQKYLADQGYDPMYGARPLKRVIQQEVMNQLAKLMIDGSMMDGDGVTVDSRNGLLTFDVVRGAGSEQLRVSLAAKGQTVPDDDDDSD